MHASAQPSQGLARGRRHYGSSFGKIQISSESQDQNENKNESAKQKADQIRGHIRPPPLRAQVVSGDCDRRLAALWASASETSTTTALAAPTKVSKSVNSPRFRERHRRSSVTLLAALLTVALFASSNSATSLPGFAARSPRQATGAPPGTDTNPAASPAASESELPSSENEPSASSSVEAASDEGPITEVTVPATTTTTTTSTTTTTTTTTPAPAKPLKIAPVNYTRVYELFEAPLDEAEVVQKWHKLDKTLHTSIGQVLKIVFPHIVSMSSDAKVSGSCSGAILKWILSLKAMRTWAVRMLDAIGKPSAGLLEGSLTLFGNYRQCLGVRAPDEDEIELADGEFREYFRGQYCVLQIKPPLAQKPHFYSLNSTQESLLRKSYKYYERTAYDDLAELAMAFNFVKIRADLCVPSLCSRDDIQRVADYLVGKLDMRARVLRCETAPQTSTELLSQSGSGDAGTGPSQVAHLSSSSTTELTHLVWALIFVILLLLVLVSTLTSVVFRIRKRTNKSKTKSIFTSMSVYRSLSHIRNVQLDQINESKPVVLYSLRIILLFWIFLVSLTSQLNFQFLRELLSLRSLIMMWPMQFLVNSSLAYEALIHLTAFTYSYQNINSNLSDLIKYNVSKYSRLMPSVMFLVALTIITPLLYEGHSPIWLDFVQEQSTVCKSNGLINLLFLQNFLNSKQICLPQSWLFCVEFQLCLLAIPIVYLMNKSFESQHGSFRLNSSANLILILVALTGCLKNFFSIYSNQLPPAWFLTFPDEDDKQMFESAHLFKTQTHLTTFAVGLFSGHLCRCQTIETFSGAPYGRRCCDNLMWLTSGLLAIGLIFGTHPWSLSGRAHLDWPLASASYAALAPLLWSVAISMILFQLTVPKCAYKGSNIASERSCLVRLLTSDVNLVRIGRLSFLAYLLNPYINTLVFAMQEQAIFGASIMLVHTFVGNLVLTYTLAFIVSALIELPCRRLIKKLLIGSRRQCTNLDIIGRQLNIRQQAQGPSHDSFLATTTSSATANPNTSHTNSASARQQMDQRHPLTGSELGARSKHSFGREALVGGNGTGGQAAMMIPLK